MTTPDLNKLITIFDLVRKHNHLNTGGVRWMLAKRKENGLQETGAVVKIHIHKLLIDEEKFMEWFYKRTN